MGQKLGVLHLAIAFFFNNFIHGFMDQQLQHRSRSRALQRRPKAAIHGRRRPKEAIGQRPRSTAAEGRRRGQVPCRLNDYNCNRNRFLSPTSVLYFWGTGAVAISGRFSALPPPRKRSSRPSLSLYLDFPLTSTLTFAASDQFPVSHSPPQVRVRAPASATSAAAATTTAAATTATAAEVSVSVGVARAHARADDNGSGGDTTLGGRRFTAAAAVRGWWTVKRRGGGEAAAAAVAL